MLSGYQKLGVARVDEQRVSGGANMPNGGFIKLHRSILDWEWYGDRNTRDLFIHLLLKANHEPTKWKGITVERGQTVTGRLALSKELGISERSVRTALNHLKSTNELTIKATNKYSLVTIVNYAKYQDRPCQSDQQSDQQPDTQATSNRPASDHKQEDKNIRTKEERNITPPISPPTEVVGEKRKSQSGLIRDDEALQIIGQWTENQPLRDTLMEFVKHRRAIKKPMTEYALKRLFPKLKSIAGSEEEQIEVLSQSIVNGWQGVFAPRDQQSWQSDKSGSAANATITDDEYLRMKREHEERLRRK